MKNKKKIIGIGTGGSAKVIVDIINQTNSNNIVGFISKYSSEKGVYLGLPVLGTDKDLDNVYKSGLKNAFIAVNKIRDTKKNKKIFNKLKKIGFNIPNIIHPKTIISLDCKIDEGLKAFAGATVNPSTKIGKNVLLNTNSTVDHDCMIGDHVQISPGAILAGNVNIDEGTVVGMGSRIIEGVTIGKYCMIGAGSIVTKNVPDNSLVIGNSSKKVGKWLK